MFVVLHVFSWKWKWNWFFFLICLDFLQKSEMNYLMYFKNLVYLSPPSNLNMTYFSSPEATAFRTVQRPAETMFTPFSRDALPSHNMKNMCRICYRPLKKKSENRPQPFSHVEPSVVAVLVCGHLYHADCLEGRTNREEQTDPSCPLCGSLKSWGEA